MKKIRMNKKVGVWLNTEESYIITIVEKDAPPMRKIRSGIQSRPREPGQKKPYTQFESAYGNSETHQQGRNAQLKKQYLKKIIDSLRDADYVYIAGPGKMKNELNNAARKETDLHSKIIKVVTTQELTQKEIIAQIKNYFNSDQYRNDKKSLTLTLA
jgi:hypothetical protein